MRRTPNPNPPIFEPGRHHPPLLCQLHGYYPLSQPITQPPLAQYLIYWSFPPTQPIDNPHPATQPEVSVRHRPSPPMVANTMCVQYGYPPHANLEIYNAVGEVSRTPSRPASTGTSVPNSSPADERVGIDRRAGKEPKVEERTRKKKGVSGGGRVLYSFPRKKQGEGSSNGNGALELKVEEIQAVGKTTVMIRNIPNTIRRAMLIEILDRHCVDMNSQISSLHQSSSSAPTEPLSEFDFLYLPMDFRRGFNLGYAFVNFTTSAAITRVYRSFHNQKWYSLLRTKTCKICYARIQGYKALKDHFRKSTFMCRNSEYLPLEFNPPRNGAIQSAITTIGRLCPSPP